MDAVGRHGHAVDDSTERGEVARERDYGRVETDKARALGIAWTCNKCRYNVQRLSSTPNTDSVVSQWILHGTYMRLVTWLPFTTVGKICYSGEKQRTLRRQKVYIWKLHEYLNVAEQNIISYKVLYDMYVMTLSCVVMLFKAYPTYICFLSDIRMFLIQHIL